MSEERTPYDDGQPERPAFTIDGPDADGQVWLHGASPGEQWGRNLGSATVAASVMINWLSQLPPEITADIGTGD